MARKGLLTTSAEPADSLAQSHGFWLLTTDCQKWEELHLRTDFEGRTGSIPLQRLQEAMVAGLALPSVLRCAICSQRQSAFWETGALTVEMMQLMGRFGTRRMETWAEMLAQDALDLQCLSLSLNELSARSQTGNPCPCLSPSEANQLDMLAERLCDAPERTYSLAGLARESGMNECKLKRAFRARYGVTVFAYLRAQRMEMAHAILTIEGTTVLGAANRVGYSNPSQFARAYRRHYGCNPHHHVFGSRQQRHTGQVNHA